MWHKYPQILIKGSKNSRPLIMSFGERVNMLSNVSVNNLIHNESQQNCMCFITLELINSKKNLICIKIWVGTFFFHCPVRTERNLRCHLYQTPCVSDKGMDGSEGIMCFLVSSWEFLSPYSQAPEIYPVTYYLF